MKKLWKLFTTMLSISAFTFGGGFVIVSLMKRKLVDELNWLDEEEMLDITALAQTAPGAIAVNASILAGRRVAGVPGLICAVVGTLIPPVVILTVISFIYEAFAANVWVRAAMGGMQAGVAAVVVDVALALGQKVVKTRDHLHLAVMAAAFAAAFFFKVNVLWIFLAAILIGLLRLKQAQRDGEAP